MAVLIDNRHPNPPVGIKSVQKKARAILNALGCPEGELSILLVKDDDIARLNRMYLNHRGPTNVISFSMREGEHGEIHPEVLGDVVISIDTCTRESSAAGMSAAERFDELLVHGILHLFGYDHVHSKTEAQVMEAKSRELTALIKDI